MVHFNEWHEYSLAVRQHLVVVGGLEDAIDRVFDCPGGSVHIRLHNIALLEPISFLITLLEFPPIIAVVAHRIF